MKISACVIVKNEAKNIRSYLEHIQPVADEIIVVDTGSTDATLAIVREYGIEPYHFTWCDDFALAKNYAIAHATGDWLVFLDADEYFSQASMDKLRGIVERYHAKYRVGAIRCRLINIDTDRQNAIIDSMLQVRIFRRVAGIGYEGRVHELLALAHGYHEVCEQGLVIYHTGYSTHLVVAKAKRNLPLLLAREREAKSQQEKDSLCLYLMDIYNCLGEYAKMLQYVERAIAVGLCTTGDRSHAYRYRISALRKLDRPAEELMTAIEDAMARLPEDAYFYIEKGYLLFQQKNYLEAEHLFERALELRAAMKQRLQAGQDEVDTSLRLVPLLYSELAEIYYLQHRTAEAEVLVQAGLTVDKYDVRLVRLLCRMNMAKPSEEMIGIFAGIYDRKQDSAFINRALLGMDVPQLIDYFCPANEQDLGVLLQANRYTEAVEVYIKHKN